MLFSNYHGSFWIFFSDRRSLTFICLILIFDRRKFGLVCALLNQCVYILFVLLLMIMMKKQVDAKGQQVSCFILWIKTKIVKSELINVTRAWDKKKNAFPTGIDLLMASRTLQGGRSIHWATRTNWIWVHMSHLITRNTKKGAMLTLWHAFFCTNYQVWNLTFPRVCNGFLCDFAKSLKFRVINGAVKTFSRPWSQKLQAIFKMRYS